MKNTKTIIPIFFSTDDCYAPFLGVAIKSITSNVNRNYCCKFYILINELSQHNINSLKKCVGNAHAVEFVNVGRYVERFKDRLHLRDYYSQATYYRFLIQNMFPQYDKAIYLDCDVIVNKDISEFYNIELGDALLAGAKEEVMQEIDVFGTYVEKVLEIPREEYINAGVLLMNLKEFRRCDMLESFISLLGKRRFDVTQDQDYLNVLANGNMIVLGYDWNKTPIINQEYGNKIPNLVHYKINWKPWHYNNVLYGDLFWKYAFKTVYYLELQKMLRSYTDEEKARDSKAFDDLYDLAVKETKCAEEALHSLNA